MNTAACSGEKPATNRLVLINGTQHHHDDMHNYDVSLNTACCCAMRVQHDGTYDTKQKTEGGEKKAEKLGTVRETDTQPREEEFSHSNKDGNSMCYEYFDDCCCIMEYSYDVLIESNSMFLSCRSGCCGIKAKPTLSGILATHMSSASERVMSGSFSTLCATIAASIRFCS